jgi:hypothetical protein
LLGEQANVVFGFGLYNSTQNGRDVVGRHNRFLNLTPGFVQKHGSF